eukprot:COSAG01_NODE_12176_length_1786_cov_1.698874_2_plen_269_part_00
MAGAGISAPAQRITDLLAGSSAQRFEAYSALTQLAACTGKEGATDTTNAGGTDEPLSVALACVGSLMEAAFTAAADAAEYQRACVVLGALHALNPLAVAAEAWQSDACVIKLAMATDGNAYRRVFAKSAPELTREDALTVACATISYAIFFSRGPDRILAKAGSSFPVFIESVQKYQAVIPSSPISSSFFENLAVLLLDIILCAPEPPDTSDDDTSSEELVLSGAAMELSWCLSGRPTVAKTLAEAGLIEAAVAVLRRSAPPEWICWQ